MLNCVTIRLVFRLAHADILEDFPHLAGGKRKAVAEFLAEVGSVSVTIETLELWVVDDLAHEHLALLHRHVGNQRSLRRGGGRERDLRKAKTGEPVWAVDLKAEFDAEGNFIELEGTFEGDSYTGALFVQGGEFPMTMKKAEE